jgi:putative addiction module component (TIGR02574 family)
LYLHCIIDMTPIEKIEAEIMELPADERVVLAYRILDTVSEDFTSLEIETAWMKEAEERLETFDKGDRERIPAKEVIAKGQALSA